MGISFVGLPGRGQLDLLLRIGGASLAGIATTLPTVWIGYSLLFGAANGFGYGFALQISAQALPERKGLAMGVVAAFYAFGATVFAIIK